jgi:hypothetical protein
MDPQQQLLLLDDLEDDLIEEIILKELPLGARKRIRTGLPGHDYVFELLTSGNDERVRQVLRMKYSTFIALRDWLLANTKLKPGKAVTVEEKLVMFLHLVSRPASNRDAQERFSHSGDTISR